MTSGSIRSMRNWRKTQRHSFGYSNVLSLFAAFVIVVIVLTGISPAHQEELRFMQNSRASTLILPNTYQHRLDQSRQQQRLAGVLPAETAVLLKWLVLELHGNDFLERWGRWYYDLIAVTFITLADAGFYLFLRAGKNYRV